MPALHDFPEEARADRIDKVGGEDPGGEEIDQHIRAGVEVVAGVLREIEVHPELCGIDARFLHLLKHHLAGVDVVDSEKALDAAALRHRGDQRGHPVVAVDQVGPSLGHNVVDHLALEHHRDAHRLLGLVAVNALAIVKDTVFCEVDVILGKHFVILLQFLLVEIEHVALEELAVVWHRDVNVRAKIKKGGDQRGRDIC